MQQAAIDSIEANVARIKRAYRPARRGRLRRAQPEQAAAIARVADGVVVGSALVELVAQHGADAPAQLAAAHRKACQGGPFCAKG